VAIHSAVSATRSLRGAVLVKFATELPAARPRTANRGCGWDGWRADHPRGAERWV